jgi:hypothetical protein
VPSSHGDKNYPSNPLYIIKDNYCHIICLSLSHQFLASIRFSMSLRDSAMDSASLDQSSLDPEKNIPEAAIGGEVEDDSEYLTGLALGLVIMGLCLAVLLVGLVKIPGNIICDLWLLIMDRTILSSPPRSQLSRRSSTR